jgi:flagellar biosynthesis component FlhA
MMMMMIIIIVIIITRTESSKDLGVQIDSKLPFHHDADYIFSQAIRLLGIIRTVPFSFCSLQSPLLLHYTLVMCKLEYASAAWNAIACTNASKHECVGRTFVSLRHRPFVSHLPYGYANVLILPEISYLK